MFDTNMNNSYGGMVFNPQNGQYQSKQASTLTQEEYDKLVKHDNPFSLALTEIELWRGFCNHRSKDGMRDTLVSDIDGTVRCEVCGYRFSPVDPNMTKEDVQEAVRLITDILQTIKLLFIDMSVPAQREYFQIIPLLDKVPNLFELAVRNFNKHESFNAWGYRGQNMGTMNLFNMLSGALNGAGPMMGGMPINNGMPMGAAGTGMFGTPVGAGPMMGGNNMGNPLMNGGYTTETNNYQYGQQNYGVDPNAVTNQANVNQNQVPATTMSTDGNEVQATAQFKA